MQAGTWTLRNPDFPASAIFNSFPITYDVVRERVIAVLRGKTYEWDGATWTEVASFGPQPRERSGVLVFRNSARAAYLFGGRIAEPVKSVGDPWEWNGSGWTKLPEFGPKERHHHAMTYDIARDRVILFGGQLEDEVLGDTWEWDGLGWTPFAAGPRSRIWHAMAYDSKRKKTVLFGGYDKTDAGDGADLADTWEWDGAVWSQLSDTGPSSRRRHAMVFDEVRSRVLLYGGQRDAKTKVAGVDTEFISQVELGDTWEWDGRHWTQLSSSGPGQQVDHGMAYDQKRKCVVLLTAGGNDTWEWVSKPGNAVEMFIAEVAPASPT